MPQLVWTANPDGKVDYCNERYHDFSGIAPMGIGEWYWEPAIYKDDHQVTIDVWNQAMKTGNIYQVEHRIKDVDRTWHWYLSRGIPVRDEHGTIIKWYGTTTNIDSIKKVQLALAESENRLKTLNQDLETIVERRTSQVRSLSKTLILAEQRERKRFSYILHENLQQLILGAKILISQHVREHKEENKGNVDDVVESIQILENALQTSNVLSIELNPPVLPSQGLDSALEWLINHMRQNYDLIVDLKTSGPISEIKNETQLMLTQMVRELLNNVVQHSGVYNAKVDIVSRIKTIQIVVCDKGRGFNPYEGMKKRIGGIHLGLFSIRERLKLFGGDLHVDSAPGKGTCTSIFLPKENG
jgi:signal transduction histidine kinase